MIDERNIYIDGVFGIVRECQALGLEADWYIFGSVSRGEKMPADVDVLCVVESYKFGKKIKKALHRRLLLAPIDLRVLSREDERQLDFIRRVKGVPMIVNFTSISPTEQF